VDHPKTKLGGRAGAQEDGEVVPKPANEHVLWIPLKEGQSEMMAL
jgi:hypothetical protein